MTTSKRNKRRNIGLFVVLSTCAVAIGFMASRTARTWAQTSVPGNATMSGTNEEAVSSTSAPSSRPSSRPVPRQIRLPKRFVEKTLEFPNGKTRKYVVYIPDDYERFPEQSHPVILFLHGSGECGRDGRKQTTVGLPRHIAGQAGKFPFIVVMPQAHTRWFRGPDEAAAWMCLESVLEEYRTDRDRVYCTGLSMGGFATWEFAISQPDAFAAIVPVCGMCPEKLVSNIVNLPVWAFHGAMDKNVPVAGTRAPINRLKKLGASPKYTEYPNKGHKSWDTAYSTKALWPWLLEQRRQPPPRVINYRVVAGPRRVWWLHAKPMKPDSKGDIPHIRAEIGENGRIDIRSRWIKAWALVSDSEPLPPGQEIEVVWNRRPVYKGPFKGVLATQPQESQAKATTQPFETTSSDTPAKPTVE